MMAKQCIVCGTQTDNPKFCGRSCAAKYNNRVVPKRRPEGECEKCKAAIPRQNRYCSVCKQILDNEQDRQNRHIKSWQDLHGKECQGAIKRFWMSKKIVFEPSSSSPSQLPLPLHVSCGEFLDSLIGICFARPAYLRRDDARRHVVLLSELKEYVPRGYAAQPGPAKTADLPVKALSGAMQDWIESYLYDDSAHPMMSSYALETTRFAAVHAWGHYAHDPEPWEITPLLDLADKNVSYFRFLRDRQFKKRFTEKMGQIDVIARVPEGCNVVGPNKIEVMAAGTDFVFHVAHCHLSSEVHDDAHLSCHESNPPVLDFGEEFRFQGAVFVLDRGSTHFWCPPEQEITANLFCHPRDWGIERDVRGVGIALPARWITHVVDHRAHSHAQPPALIPVPSWTAEIYG
jgi:predicted nucleic acid-binding Zn ribbon protein